MSYIIGYPCVDLAIRKSSNVIGLHISVCVLMNIDNADAQNKSFARVSNNDILDTRYPHTTGGT